uniref:Photosystem I reaction center subunit PsaK n=1 Tax=Halydictyon mirabile TaxID=189652 RepID=A0A4D6WWR5_9FLOR|nr:photosystem I reaction center subunit X [Halydictyon mirabile]
MLSLNLITESNGWSSTTVFIMITCNLITVLLGRYSIQMRSLGPSIRILGLDGLGLPELIATTSLGHILGVGTILGLKSINLI